MDMLIKKFGEGISQIIKQHESNSKCSRNSLHMEKYHDHNYLFGDEGNIISLQGSDGDGAKGTDLRLCILGQQWDGLRQ